MRTCPTHQAFCSRFDGAPCELQGYHTQPPIIVSEFMKRGSLHSYLRKRDDVGGLDPQRLKAVLLSVARGMNYLHARNPPILHLDLKSPNILVRDHLKACLGFRMGDRARLLYPVDCIDIVER